MQRTPANPPFDPSHPGQPIVVNLTAQGIREAVGSSRDALGTDQVAENLRKIRGKSDLPEHVEESKRQAKDLGRHTGNRPDLAAVAAELKPCLREAYVVAAKAGSRNAHDILLRLVTELEDIVSIKGRSGGNIVADAYVQTKHAKDACERFCEIVGADSAVAYYWDQQTNRTKVLYRRVSFPECMDGISFVHDVPRRELFRDELCSPVDELDTVDVGLGSFQAREQIAICWVVRARWSQGRIAIFLNWRQGNNPLLRPPNAKLGDPLGREMEPRDLRPAVRYLSGYLSSLNLAIVDDRRRPTWTPFDVVQELWQIANLPFPSKEQRAQPPHKNGMTEGLRRIVRALVQDNYPKLRCSVHWTDWDVSGGDVRTLHFRRVDAPEGHETATRDFPLGPLPENSRGLVKKSITYQAAQWGAPIFIQDMRNGTNAALWQSIDLSPADNSDFQTASQMAVPFKDSKGRLIGVVNAETDSTDLFGNKSLRAVQLAGAVFGRLLETRLNNGLARSFLHQSLEGPKRASDVDAFIRQFCDFILGVKALGVSQVYLLVYDPEARVFRPRAVRCAESHYDTAWRRLVGSDRGRSPMPPAELMDAAVARLLLPKRRGRSYGAFAHGKRHVLWPTDKERPHPSRYTQECFRATIGLPFRSDVGAQPDGVLWLRWEDHPTQCLDAATKKRVAVLRPDNVPPDDLRESVKAQLEQKVDEQLGELIGVVAAIYSLLRVGETARIREES